MIVTGKRVFLCGALGISLLCSSMSFSRDFGAGLAVGGLTGLVGGTILNRAASHHATRYSHDDVYEMKRTIRRLKQQLKARENEIDDLRERLEELNAS